MKPHFLIIFTLISQYDIISSRYYPKDPTRLVDILRPYTHFHGPSRNNQEIKKLQAKTYGDQTYEVYPPHTGADVPVIESFRKFVQPDPADPDCYITGHHIIINNPAKTVSVLEPLRTGGCQDEILETVLGSAQQKECIVAVNAGFFNISTGACIGNVVSDGREVMDSHGVQNAQFGIQPNGTLFFGYIPETINLGSTFSQLVSGVIWLVRDGQNYVNASIEAEDGDATGESTIEHFSYTDSARVAVGHDFEGHLIIVQVDGKTDSNGISAFNFANMLIDLGVINAINLDGGGSATVIENDTLVNYPGDRCLIDDFYYSCEREVSTILCVHDVSTG